MCTMCLDPVKEIRLNSFVGHVSLKEPLQNWTSGSWFMSFIGVCTQKNPHSTCGHNQSGAGGD
jgi:hypothetical protein